MVERRVDHVNEEAEWVEWDMGHISEEAMALELGPGR